MIMLADDDKMMRMTKMVVMGTMMMVMIRTIAIQRPSPCWSSPSRGVVDGIVLSKKNSENFQFPLFLRWWVGPGCYEEGHSYERPPEKHQLLLAWKMRLREAHAQRIGSFSLPNIKTKKWFVLTSFYPQAALHPANNLFWADQWPREERCMPGSVFFTHKSNWENGQILVWVLSHCSPLLAGSTVGPVLQVAPAAAPVRLLRFIDHNPTIVFQAPALPFQCTFDAQNSRVILFYHPIYLLDRLIRTNGISDKSATIILESPNTVSSLRTKEG